MTFFSQSLSRVRCFFTAALSATLMTVVALPVVSSAWTPTTPQISVSIFGGTGSEWAQSMAVDASGNVYTTGFFEGTADFDPGVGTHSLASYGGDDLFVSKLNSSGEYIWAKQIGGTSNDGGNTVVVDAQGNVYITGYFLGAVDFDPGSGIQTLTSAGSHDAFVLKLNSSGEYIWAKQIGDIGFDYGQSVAVDASANVYMTGGFNGAVDFDPGSGIQTLTSAGSDDVFVSKLNSSGEYIWAKRFGTTTTEAVESVALDASGNVYTTGTFRGAVDFDPGSGTQNLTSTGSNPDVFVSKLNSSGAYVWAKKFGGTGFDLVRSVAVDASGYVYTTGMFEGAVDFDPGEDSRTLTSVGVGDAFVSKLNSSGDLVWAKRFGASGNAYGFSVAVDASGYVYTTGYFSGSIDFDPGVDITTLTSAGNNDAFVSKLNSSGDLVWVKQIGGLNRQDGLSVAVDSLGNVYTAGYFVGTVDFDPGVGTTTLTSTGSDDVFVLRLNPSGEALTSAAATTSTTTTTVLTTTTTTIPVTTATVPSTTTTVLTTTTTTTVPAVVALAITVNKSVTSKAIATYAALTINTGSVMSLTVASPSSKFCKVSGSKLMGLKNGACKVTVTVKPAKGKSVSKTLTLKVSK